MKNEDSKRAYFAFYQSFADTLCKLPDEDRLQCFDAIVRYAFTREEPSEGGILGIIFPLIKPILDKDWIRYQNGSKGGRKPKPNRCETEAEPMRNPIKDKGEDHKAKGNKKEYSADFERFWKEYPLHEDKQSAFAAYQDRINAGDAAEDLVRAAQGYAERIHRDHIEPRFVKLASNFLDRLDVADYAARKDTPFDIEKFFEDICKEGKKQ